MEVNANINTDSVHPPRVQKQRPAPAASGMDGTSFIRAEGLNRQLAATPAARPEAVQRARELIGDVKYPPADAIRGIASLLALSIEPTE